MQEFILNVHNHTRYSDGNATHRQLAEAAYSAGIDGVFVTDHNVFVDNVAGYYEIGEQKIMLLVGEEVHDRLLDPQKNHLLVLGAQAELTQYSANPQNLINQARERGGLTYLAHPFEDALPLFNETDITWENWAATGYTGLEVWNGLSELKTVVRNRFEALIAALVPNAIARGPNQDAMRKWDELNAAGGQFYALGGTDSHQLRVSMGPFTKTLFPYEWHYQTINNHVLLQDPLFGDFEEDRQRIIVAMRNGNYFIGYDLPEWTTGFRFYGSTQGSHIPMGGSARLDAPVTLQASLPARCLAVLYRDGAEAARWVNQEKCAFHVSEPGVYRIQCYIQYYGRQRTWIISNPIFIKPAAKKPLT